KSSAPFEWTGVVSVAAGRGRVDVVSGNCPGLFETGDHVLFDSTDFIVVRPRSKSYFSNRLSGSTNAKLSSSQLKMIFLNPQVTGESLGPGEPIATQPTQHFRITATYS